MASAVAEFAVLWEGILFIGIFRTAGGGLDRQIAQDAIVKALKAIASLVPLLGTAVNVFGFFDAWRKWRELDSIPDIVQQADRLDVYLNSYENLCTEWLRIADKLRDELSSMLASIESNGN